MNQLAEDTLKTVKSTLGPLDIRKHSEHTRALLALSMVCLLWGTTWLISKKGVQYIPAIQLSGMRHFFGGGIYILYFLAKGHKWPTRKQFIQYTWMSVLMFVISNGFSVWSVQYLPSGLASVIGAISPIWIAIFSLVLFRDARLNLTALIGLVLGFGGIVIIFSDYLSDIFNSNFMIGIGFGLVASMTWALGTLYTVRHSRDNDPYYSLGWQMFISGVILNLISYMTGLHVPFAEVDHRAWFSIAYLVVIGSMITFAAFIYTLKRLPAAQASIYAYINPIVAVIIGSLLNHEKLNLLIALGTLVTLLGVYLVNSGFKKASTQMS